MDLYSKWLFSLKKKRKEERKAFQFYNHAVHTHIIISVYLSIYWQRKNEHAYKIHKINTNTKYIKYLTENFEWNIIRSKQQFSLESEIISNFFILLFFHNKDILFLWFEEKKIRLPFFATISDFPYTQKFFSSKHFENNVIATTLFLILTSIISYLRLEMYCYT